MSKTRVAGLACALTSLTYIKLASALTPLNYKYVFGVGCNPAARTRKICRLLLCSLLTVPKTNPASLPRMGKINGTRQKQFGERSRGETNHVSGARVSTCKFQSNQPIFDSHLGSTNYKSSNKRWHAEGHAQHSQKNPEKHEQTQKHTTSYPRKH